MRICSRCRKCYDDSVEVCVDHGDEALSVIRSGSPEMISGYRLDQLLESGLKGDLFRACQIECRQTCRIRIISPKKKSGSQFLREAKIVSSLFHPHLVDVYDVGPLPNDEFFIVSEEAVGQTLRDHLKVTGVPPLLNTIRIMEQTAEA